MTLFSLVLNSSAQTITLSGEVLWQEKELYLLKYEKASVPFIRLTFSNNSRDSVYFYNFFNKHIVNSSRYLQFVYEEPLVSYVENYFPPDPWDTLIDSFPDWSDNTFKVLISKEYNNTIIRRNLLINEGAKVNLKSVESSKYQRVVCLLTDLINAQDDLNAGETNYQYKYFQYPNRVVKPDSIFQKEMEVINNKVNNYILSEEYKLRLLERDSMNKKIYPLKVSQRVYGLIEEEMYSECVFLRPFESISYDFDLTPFYLLKGSYHFVTESQKIPRKYIFLNPYIIPKEYQLNDKNLNCVGINENYFEYKFPSHYKGYKYYNRKINGVSIQLDIK